MTEFTGSYGESGWTFLLTTGNRLWPNEDNNLYVMIPLHNPEITLAPDADRSHEPRVYAWYRIAGHSTQRDDGMWETVLEPVPEADLQ